MRRDTLEDDVLRALRDRLMDPDLFKAFVEAFTAEWNRLQAEGSADQDAKCAELRKVRQTIERLVDVLADGTPAAAVRDRLAHLEERRIALEADLAVAVAPAPRLHPNLAEVYRQRVATLSATLARDDAAEAGAVHIWFAAAVVASDRRFRRPGCRVR